MQCKPFVLRYPGMNGLVSAEFALGYLRANGIVMLATASWP